MTGAWIAAVAALWVLVLLLAFLVLGTLRRITGVLERVEEMLTREEPALGAQPMTVVEPFQLRTADGEPLSSDELLVEPLTILLFIEPLCVSCQRLIDQFEDVDERLEGIPFFVVTSGPDEGQSFKFPPGLRVLYEEDSSVTQIFTNRATPQAYTIGSDRFVLDRRLPTSFSDLRDMAAFQRDRGGEAIASVE